MIEVDYVDEDVLDHDDNVGVYTKYNDDDDDAISWEMCCAWLGEPCQICRQMTAKG